MPFDGGLITGVLVAYAFRKYRKHRRERQRLNPQRPLATYYPPPRPHVQETDMKLNAKLQQTTIALVEAQQQPKSHDDKAGARGPGRKNVDNKAKGEAAKLHTKLKKQEKMKKTKWGNMGGGKRGVPVPAPTATESPKFKKSLASSGKGRDIIL